MELALQLETQSDLPLHQQIYDQLRDAILSGDLRSQQRLPASRYLAQTLGVSRTTVTQSYDQLIIEGYLETRVGAGTFVCSQLPEELLEAYRPEVTADAEDSDAGYDENSSALGLGEISLSDYGDRLIQTPDRVFSPKAELSFVYGVPALDHFPVKRWRQLWNRYATANVDWMGYATDPMGYMPLRSQIAEYIAQVRALRCGPEQILITNGTQQALSLIVRVLIDAASSARDMQADAIAIENPGYVSARRIFSSSGAQLVPIPVDSGGMVIDGPNGLRSQSTKRPVKLVYVTPSHQFPTGVLMPLSRRLALLQWAQENNAIIIEDDYDSEFRYSGRPTPALQGLDSYGQVLYVGTFSKVMFPGLRLGYVVLPPALVPLFRRSKWLADRQCSLIDQQTLTSFIADGHMSKHIRRMRNLYAGRRRVLIQRLHEAFACSRKPGEATGDAQNESVEILGDEAGLHVMAKLPLRRSDAQVIADAQSLGVTLFSARSQYLSETEGGFVGSLQALTNDSHTDSQGEFIFGFGHISEQSIGEAFDRMASVFA